MIENAARHLTTESLLAARECAGWDRADLDHDPDGWDFPADTAAFLDWRIAEDEAELARRERLRSHPMAPDWPERRHDLDGIRARVDLATYVERITAAMFVRRGKRLWASCPLPDHHDITPSFCIGPDPSLWYCFGCGRGGDIFTFCQAIHGDIAFRTAIDLLAREAGVEIPRPTGRRRRSRPQRGSVRVA